MPPSLHRLVRRTASPELAALAFLTVVMCSTAAAQTSIVYVPSIATVAGTGTAGATGNNGPAIAAQLSADSNVAYDASGNLYISDTNNHAIRKVSGGVITTFAGTLGTSGFSGDGGPATSALLHGPQGIAFDSAGNLYIADSSNARIREVTTNGTINTIAGSGTAATYTADGPALTSPLDLPKGIAVDSAGNVYIGDSGSNRVLEVTGGQLVLYAGSTNAGGIGGDGGNAKTAAKFAGPPGVCLDTAGNLYLVDKSHSNVRKVTASTGNISTVAGSATGTAGSTGDGGLATAALLSAPLACFVDTAGNLYITDTGNQKIRVVNATTQNISTYAGTGTAGYTGDGGPPTSATLSSPSGVSVSAASGQVAIADTGNSVVRAVSAGGSGGYPATNVGSTSTAVSVNASVVTTDTLQSYGLATTTPADFTFGTVTGCTVPGVETAGTVCSAPVAFTPTAPGTRINQVVAQDASNTKYIYAIVGTGTAPAVGLAPGTISDYAGTGTAGSSGDGGAATSATLNTPSGVALDGAGNLYIAGTGSNKVRVVNAASGNIATAAGTGAAGYTGDGVAATAATLNGPNGVALDTSGNIYIADTGNNVIRKISAQTGFISTVAATSGILAGPKGVGVDLLGDLFIADTGNNTIREVSAAGTISTVSGVTGLLAPAGVSVDATGNLYIADTGNNAIRKLSGGTLTVVAGTPGVSGSSGDGGAATSARLNAPTDVVLDAAGDLYITDSGNNKIRFVSAASGTISTLAGLGTAGSSGNGGNATAAQLTGPAGVAVNQFGSLFIADTGNNRIEKVDSTSVSLAYGPVNINTTTAPQTITVTNIGNAGLTLSKIAITSGFNQVASGGTDCTASTALAAGASCLIAITFKPTTPTTYTGSVSITDNALNNAASVQNISVSGTGTIPGVPTTVSITAGNNQTVTPLAPFPINLQVQVQDQFSHPSAGVSVVFTVPATGASGTFANGTNTTTALTNSNGTATATVLTAGFTRGPFTATALAAGIATPASFSETIAGNPTPQVQVSFTPATSPQVYGQTIQLTAKLVPSVLGGTNATGTVTFYDNNNSIGSAPVNSGSATLSYLPQAGANQVFTAMYSGDSNFSGTLAANSTPSSALTVTPLGITAAVPSISLVYSPAFSTPIPAQAAALATSGTLTGVLPADVSNVTGTYTSTGLVYGTPTLSGPNPVGTAGVAVYPITTALSGSAASNYTVTSTTGNVSITQAGTSTLVTSSNYSPGTGSSVTLTAVVASSTSGTPTGSVIFYSGTTSLGSGTLSAGKATLATIALPLGNDSVTAVYQGSTNFSGSTSPAILINVATPNYSISINPTSVTLAQGDSAAVAVSISTVGSFAGTITFSCSGLPANAYCIFVPAVLSPTATTTSVSGLIEIVTSGPGTTIGSLRPSHGSGTSMAALIGLSTLVLCFGFRKRGRLGKQLRVCGLTLALALCLGAGLSGCGNGSSVATVLTPVGNSTVSVTGVSGGLTQSTPLNVTVVAVRP